ncbi:MAG: IS4 family transposase [Candidatus Bathyarchaeia archaeon]
MKLSCIINRVAVLREKLSNSIGFPFREILTETMIQRALQEEGISYRKRLYTPMITLWIWLCQVLDKDKSCKKAVSRIVSYLIASGDTPPSTNTAGYCKARKRLKERFLLRLVRYIGKHLHQQDRGLWCGRRVFIVDGSTVTMADTQDNQTEYPQPESQAEGCGFPMANIVALFCLTGALLEAVIDALTTHELNLFRSLYQRLQPGDVALGDRLYGSYADVCLIQANKLDCVFRMHWRRKTDFRKGKILGCYDHIVHWIKPHTRPQGLDPALYEKLPENIKLREVRFRVETKGFRSQEITLVTTLLDADAYPKEALAELYSLRWDVEINLRHLKTTMQMEHLSARTPHMVRNEFYVHLLAYNLIRTIMSQAAAEHEITPLGMSFQATIQHLSNFIYILAYADAELRESIYSALLYLVSKERLLIRKGRVEPRVKKRRPKNYGWLQQPRRQLQKQLIA